MGRAEAMSDSTNQAKDSYAEFIDLWRGVDAGMPALRRVSAEAGKLSCPGESAGGIRREIPFPGGQRNLQIADRAQPAVLRCQTLLLAGQFYGDAQQQLAIALFHLPEQAPNAIEEATPFAREAPFLGR